MPRGPGSAEPQTLTARAPDASFSMGLVWGGEEEGRSRQEDCQNDDSTSESLSPVESRKPDLGKPGSGSGTSLRP